MSSSPEMTPFALSLLGVEQPARRTQQEPIEQETTAQDAVQPLHALRPARPSRRALSYYNSFQATCSPCDDEPPSYLSSLRQRQQHHDRFVQGREALPSYTCTVGTEGKLLLQLEAVNPLHCATEGDWKEVYFVLRGTMLNIHRCKDGKAGKLLRQYTLQHAEVGLASDTQHTVLLPQSRLAHLIPSGARRKAWQKEPDLFKPLRQHILRLRVETDQILLADPSEDRIHSLLYDIGAAIDISHAIDDRSIPRQCTVPRRRRRARPTQTGDLSDPTLLAEQERILRDMYPAFAEEAPNSNASTASVHTSADTAPTIAQDEDELDLSAIREESTAASSPPPTRAGDPTSRPAITRQATTESVASAYSVDMMYATSAANFNPDSKWEPPHTRSAQQVHRYMRRCLPVLQADAPRASDVLISNGRRVKINWRIELMAQWELQPPSYKSHNFDIGSSLGRTPSSSQSLAFRTAPRDNAHASTSDLGSEDDQINPTEDSATNLDLTKLLSIAKSGKIVSRDRTRSKTPDSRHGADLQQVAFCF